MRYFSISRQFSPENTTLRIFSFPLLPTAAQLSSPIITLLMYQFQYEIDLICINYTHLQPYHFKKAIFIFFPARSQEIWKNRRTWEEFITKTEMYCRNWKKKDKIDKIESERGKSRTELEIGLRLDLNELNHYYSSLKEEEDGDISGRWSFFERVGKLSKHWKNMYRLHLKPRTKDIISFSSKTW